MLGVRPFQYENILVTPLNGLYVTGDVLILSWDRINRLNPGQAVSLGVYNDKCGVEWCVDTHNYIQFFVRCPKEHDKAVVHWIFDYVLKGSERRHLPPERLKFQALAAAGDYKMIFQHLKNLLAEFQAE